MASQLLLVDGQIEDFQGFELVVEKAFAQGLRRHHALDDARANRVGWLQQDARNVFSSLR